MSNTTTSTINKEIRDVVADATYTAHCVLDFNTDGLAVEYVFDESNPLDGYLNTQTKVITINKAQLAKYASKFGLEDMHAAILLEVRIVMYHELRHLYQFQTVTNYTINKIMGEKMNPQPESDATCEAWLAEMDAYTPNSNEYLLEHDATAFCDYMLLRLKHVKNINHADLDADLMKKMLTSMRRKYNRKKIPWVDD